MKACVFVWAIWHPHLYTVLQTRLMAEERSKEEAKDDWLWVRHVSRSPIRGEKSTPTPSTLIKAMHTQRRRETPHPTSLLKKNVKNNIKHDQPLWIKQALLCWKNMLEKRNYNHQYQSHAQTTVDQIKSPKRPFLSTRLTVSSGRTPQHSSNKK